MFNFLDFYSLKMKILLKIDKSNSIAITLILFLQHYQVSRFYLL